MKKKILGLLVIAAIAVFSNSCKKDEVSFDESLLYGSWKQIDGADTYYYTYNSDGTGKYRYNDQPIELARDITWKLDKADFTIIHKSDQGTWETPEYYTITSLTSSTLKFKDDFGVEYTQTKLVSK